MFKKPTYRTTAFMVTIIAWSAFMVWGGWHLHSQNIQPSYCKQAGDIATKTTKDATRWVYGKSNEVKTKASELYQKTNNKLRTTWNLYMPQKMHIKKSIEPKKKALPQPCWKQYLWMKCTQKQ